MSPKFELKRASPKFAKFAIFVLICITIFFIFYYIFIDLGNNKINQVERIDDILEKYKRYEAGAVINIYSNKTENIYKVEQIVDEDYSKLIIKEPSNISGMTIEKKNNTLKITNSLLNVEKCYNNQTDLMNNFLFLNVFVKEYEETMPEIEQSDEEIKVKIKLENNNTYVKSKELIIDRLTGKPKKLIIKDNTNQDKICIIYNDISI